MTTNNTPPNEQLIEVRPQPKSPSRGPQQPRSPGFVGTADDDSEPYGLCSKILIVIAYIITIITFPISVFGCIKIVNQYERAVIFRLGQLKKGGAKGPGFCF
jgi:erythrocyte band 7 integral membrane protein